MVSSLVNCAEKKFRKKQGNMSDLVDFAKLPRINISLISEQGTPWNFSRYFREIQQNQI
jgi:hypothetical protein